MNSYIKLSTKGEMQGFEEPSKEIIIVGGEFSYRIAIEHPNDTQGN
jgi:hypothetical protein